MKLKYTIIRSSRKTLAIEVKNGEVFVRSPRRVSNVQIDIFVREHRDWIEKQLEKQEAEREVTVKQKKLTLEELNELKNQARAVIPQRVSYYAGKIGVTYGRISIRCQHTRWGSCSSKGNLNFNCLLMLMPSEVLDSVIVHELCHRKEMNHSVKFYELVHKAFPEYDKWNRWLKKNGSQYLNMLSNG